jgi:hypothetical protein
VSTEANPLESVRRSISSAVKQMRYHARNRRTRTFFVSFPKTGRTWLRVLVGRAVAARTGQSEDIVLDTYRVTDGLPQGPARFSHGGPLYLLDPCPYEDMTFDHDLYRGKQVVHLIRDVRDTLVSYYFQVCKREKIFEGDMTTFLRHPQYGARKIVRYYTLWYENQAVPAAFMLRRYEDLHADTHGQLCDILRFLGVGEPFEDAVAVAVEYASFKNMRKLESGQTFNRDVMKPGDPNDAESFKTRKGKVGAFGEYLDAGHQRYIHDMVVELGHPECDWYYGPGLAVSD